MRRVRNTTASGVVLVHDALIATIMGANCDGPPKISSLCIVAALAIGAVDKAGERKVVQSAAGAVSQVSLDPVVVQ
jgi:hypothetical protein